MGGTCEFMAGGSYVSLFPHRHVPVYASLSLIMEISAILRGVGVCGCECSNVNVAEEIESGE